MRPSGLGSSDSPHVIPPASVDQLMLFHVDCGLMAVLDHANTHAMAAALALGPLMGVS